MLKLTCSDVTPITKWEEWPLPKRDCQWKEGRSTMELAKFCFRNSVPVPHGNFLICSTPMTEPKRFNLSAVHLKRSLGYQREEMGGIMTWL